MLFDYSMPANTGTIVWFASALSVLSTALWLLSTTTEWWEYSTYSHDTLLANHPDTNDEVFNITVYPGNGLILVTRMTTAVSSTEYLYEEHSGIWQMCSYLSDQNRSFLLNDSGVTDWYASYPCFIYVKHYKIPKIHKSMSEESKWLVRMQNSATSCVIVVFLLMMSSAVLAPFGVLRKIVSVCMVVAVMYGIGVMFAVFGVCIIHAKINFMNSESKYIIGRPPSESAYQARAVSIGWSVYVAWLSTLLQLLCFCMWTWVCRTIRPDKATYTLT